MRKTIIALCAVAMALTSCGDWLDVEPKTYVE